MRLLQRWEILVNIDTVRAGVKASGKTLRTGLSFDHDRFTRADLFLVAAHLVSDPRARMRTA